MGSLPPQALPPALPSWLAYSPLISWRWDIHLVVELESQHTQAVSLSIRRVFHCPQQERPLTGFITHFRALYPAWAPGTHTIFLPVPGCLWLPFSIFLLGGAVLVALRTFLSCPCSHLPHFKMGDILSRSQLTSPTVWTASGRYH